MEKVEEVYKKNSLVEQIFVYGNSMESTLVAVLVPVGKPLGQLPHPGTTACSEEDLLARTIHSTKSVRTVCLLVAVPVLVPN